MARKIRTKQIRLTITKNGVDYVLKTCLGCGDDWYTKRKQNRCTLCGVGLVMRTEENRDKDWDQLKPESTNAVLNDLRRKANLAGVTL